MKGDAHKRVASDAEEELYSSSTQALGHGESTSLLAYQDRSGRKLRDFVAELAGEPEITSLRQRVRDFSVSFGMP